jgi:MFS transporter, DHA2 family, multidrug resistance protein
MMPDVVPLRLRGWQFILFNLVLGVAHLIVLFNAASYIAFLPHVTGSLGGVLPSFGTWAQTDFMVALALAFPVARWLSCRFGDGPVFIGAFLGYAVASCLCAMSESLALFLPGRVLLGFAGGLTLPIGQALLLKEYPDRLKSVALGVWGFFTLMPFTIGLPVGGWIADELGWRYLFYLNVPVALVVAGLTWALLIGRRFESRCLRFDYIGFLLLAIILGGIQTILNEGNDFDWWDSYFLRGMLIMVLVAVPCWIIWELEEEDPAVDLRLFRSRNFAIGLIGLTAGFFALQGLLSLFVVQLQLLMGYSSYLAGMVFLPMIVLGVPVIVVMHEVAKRVDVRLLACLNLLGFAGTFYWIGLYDDPHSFDQILWPMMVEGVFLGSFFTPLTVLTLHGLAGDKLLRAAETTNLFRIAAGAFGITAQGVILFRRGPFHQLNLSDHFGGRVSISYDALEGVTTKLHDLGFDPAAIQRHLQLAIKQEAGILALNDAFLLCSFLCIGLAVLVWFATSTRVPTLKPADALRERQAEELMEQP